MSVCLQIINRGRGKVLLSSGWQFYRHVLYKNGTSLWRCKEFKTQKKCAGSVTLNTDQKAIITQKPHCEDCEPDETQNLIDFTINQTCREAAQGKEPAPRVYKRGLALISNQGWDLAAKKPPQPFKSKQGSIYRLKNKIAGVKKIKTNKIVEVEVPQQFENFLLFDYSFGNNKILVFCSPEGIIHMGNLKTFFMDGTFTFCPKPFKQMFSIHGDIGSDLESTNIVPLVYAFMTHRDTKSYDILFSLIKKQIPMWTPKKVMIDFEESTIAALTKLNLEIDIKGCHYHFTNSLYRKATKLGITPKRGASKRNKRIIALCCNLAYLPLNRINDGWSYIKLEMPQTEIFLKFSKYFEYFWMKLQKMWCVFGERHRTNNVVEGWHHNINSGIKKNQTNLLQLLHILYDDSTLMMYRSNLLQQYGQSSQPKKRKIYQEKDELVQDAQMQLLEGSISVGHFLDKLRLT